MWRNRYDDLWLYPMPAWFVRACNKTIGTLVFDLMLVCEIVGFALAITGYATGALWLRVTGYVLLAPVPLLVLMMIITAQYRLKRITRRRIVIPTKRRE